jgi:hypothetical protein
VHDAALIVAIQIFGQLSDCDKQLKNDEQRDMTKA